MLNWIVRNRIASPVNCVQTNDWCLIELLVIDNNTLNHLTVYKQKIDIESNN